MEERRNRNNKLLNFQVMNIYFINGKFVFLIFDLFMLMFSSLKGLHYPQKKPVLGKLDYVRNNPSKVSLQNRMQLFVFYYFNISLRNFCNTRKHIKITFLVKLTTLSIIFFFFVILFTQHLFL